MQNGNAYEEGFSPAWAPFRALWANRNPETEAGIAAFYAPQFTQFFYTEGTREPQKLNPDAWNMDQLFIGRPVNQETNLELFYDYRNNPGHYAPSGKPTSASTSHRLSSCGVKAIRSLPWKEQKHICVTCPKRSSTCSTPATPRWKRRGKPSLSTSAVFCRALCDQRLRQRERSLQDPVT